MQVLWTETFVFHARKHVVAQEMMLKYEPRKPMPSVVPGFFSLLPVLADALGHLVRHEQHFPAFVPPPKLGDWTMLPAAPAARKDD